MTTSPARQRSSPTSSPRIAVVGGGVAGLACAIAAARAGAQVEAIDAQGFAPDLPAHLHVVPNMLRELAALGLGRACVEQGFPYRGLHVTDIAGRRHGGVSYANLAGPGYPAALGLRHGALLKVLVEAARAAGVTLTAGVAIEHLELEGERAALIGGDGAVRRPDLVLFAGGADSPVRRALFPGEPAAEALGQSWTYTLVPRPPGLDELRLMLSPGPGSRRLLLVPISGEEAGLVVMDPADASAVSGPLPAAPVREFLERASPFTRGLAHHVDADAPAYKRAVRAGVLAGDWHRANVVCVGDAAHAMPPQFGQSAAQALEDAVVIGELLARERDPLAIGAAFTARRAPRARQVFDIVRQAARWEAAPASDTDLSQLARRLDDAVACRP